MKADEKTEAAVIESLNKFVQAYSKKDLDGVLSLFAPDPDVMFIGTGKDEKCFGLMELKSQVEYDWSQCETLSMEIGWSTVSMAGNVAWLAADVIVRATAGLQEVSVPVRLTAVLEKREDQWFFVQWHGSLPATE